MRSWTCQELFHLNNSQYEQQETLIKPDLERDGYWDEWARDCYTTLDAACADVEALMTNHPQGFKQQLDRYPAWL